MMPEVWTFRNPARTQMVQVSLIAFSIQREINGDWSYGVDRGSDASRKGAAWRADPWGEVVSDVRTGQDGEHSADQPS